MYLKQSKNILEEFNFGDNSRSFKKIVGIIYKKYTSYDDNTITHGTVVNDEMKNDEMKNDFIEETPYIIFNTILINHIMHLQTLQEFLNYYSTFADVQNSKNIWKFYSMLKK